MNCRPTTLISQHCLKRLAAWAMLMLAWMAHVFFTDTARPNRRHIRCRFGVSLNDMVRMVLKLIIVRAVQMQSRRRNGRFSLRCAWAPAGFAQRKQPHRFFRSLTGSALRRRLSAVDGAQRIALLIAALRDLDAIAAVFAKRLKRGLTRTRPLIPVRPSHEAVRTLAAPPVCAADSS